MKCSLLVQWYVHCVFGVSLCWSVCLLKTWKLWAFQAFRDLFDVCTLQLTRPKLLHSQTQFGPTLLHVLTFISKHPFMASAQDHVRRSHRLGLDKLCYTIVKVEKRETPPCSSATMIWSLTRWTLLVFYRPQTKFLPVLQVTRFIKSKKLKQQSTNIYCQFIFYLRITLYFVANLCNKSLDLRYT